MIRNKERFINLIIAILVPIISAFFMLTINGVGINDLSVACSKWNDELFFYKQIEGVLEYGHPIGYWGFNESHSLYGNFAAWNPSILIINILFAKLFGLSYTSPIWVNIFMLVLSFILFATLCRPTPRQMLLSGIIFASYSIGIRYIFSVAPESIVGALFLMYSSFLYNYYKTKSNKSAIGSYILFILLVLMRGYYAAFTFLALSIFFKKRDRRNIIIQIIITIVAVCLFMIINRYFTAEYFEPIVHFDWINNPALFFTYLKSGILTTFYFMRQAIMRTSMRGSWYIGYFVLGVLLMILSVKKKNIVCLAMFLVWCVIIVAMWVIYFPVEGCRHVMDIELIAFIFMPILFERKVANYFLIIILVYLTWLSNDMFYTSLPVVDKNMMADVDIEYVENMMPVSADAWDNTVLWAYSDYHNELYALPKGFGINCCTDDYIINNIDCLKAKYICVLKDTETESALREQGFENILEFNNNTIYRLR